MKVIDEIRNEGVHDEVGNKLRDFESVRVPLHVNQVEGPVEVTPTSMDLKGTTTSDNGRENKKHTFAAHSPAKRMEETSRHDHREKDCASFAARPRCKVRSRSAGQTDVAAKRDKCLSRR